MGWCHEFGTQVHLGCDHPMTASPDSCYCEECGFVCTGKFIGCPDVWARGPRPITLVRPPEKPQRKLVGLDFYVAEEPAPESDVGASSKDMPASGSEMSADAPPPEPSGSGGEDTPSVPVAGESQPATGASDAQGGKGWSPSPAAEPSRSPAASGLPKGLERLLERAPATWKARLGRRPRPEQPSPRTPVTGLQEPAPASETEIPGPAPAVAEVPTLTASDDEQAGATGEPRSERAETVGSSTADASGSPSGEEREGHAAPGSPAGEPGRARSSPGDAPVGGAQWGGDWPETPGSAPTGDWPGMTEWPAAATPSPAAMADEERSEAGIGSHVPAAAEERSHLAGDLAEIREELVRSVEDAMRAIRQEMVAAVGEVAAAARSEMLGSLENALASARTEMLGSLENALASARTEMLGSVEGSLATARTEMLGSVEDSLAAARSEMRSSADEALASAREETRSWLEDATAAVRGEMRSLLNDTVGDLRADIDRMDADLRDNKAALAGVSELTLASGRLAEVSHALPARLDGLENDLSLIRSDLSSQQSAIRSLTDASAALAALVDDLQTRTSREPEETRAPATDEAASKLDDTLEEARSVLAGMQLAAAAVRAELEQLTELREQLVRENAGQPTGVDTVAVPPIVLEELAETARAGQRLGELVDELPARIAESVADVLEAEPVDAESFDAEPADAEPSPIEIGSTAGRRDEPFGRGGDLESGDWPAMLREPAQPLFEPPQPEQSGLAAQPVAPIQPEALPPILRPGPPEEPIVPVAPPRQAPAPSPQPRSPLRRFRTRRHAEPPGTTPPPGPGRRPRRGAVSPPGAGAEPPLPWEPGQAPPPSLVEEAAAVEARATPTESRPVSEPAEPTAGDAEDRFDVEAPLDLPITTDERPVIEPEPGRGMDVATESEPVDAAAEPGAEPEPALEAVADAAPLPTVDAEEPPTELEAELEPVVEPEPATAVEPEAEPETKPVAEMEVPVEAEPKPPAEEARVEAEAEPRAEPEPPLQEARVEAEPEPAAEPVAKAPGGPGPEPETASNGGAAPRDQREPASPAARDRRTSAPKSEGAPAKPRYRARALNHLADTWEGIVRQFLQGGATRTPEIEPWFGAYDGEVHYDAVPEPFVGSLASRPKAVVLSLNPGPAFAHLHARDGHFANEIKRVGSYAAWAARGPDAELPYGRKSTNASRLRFLEGWLEEAPIGAADMVTFELYPWPATSWTGRFELNPVVLELVDRYILEPVAALRPPWVFAFGPEWFKTLEGLGFVERVTLGGEHGATWAGAAPSRVVSLFEHDKKRLRIVAMRHRGSPGPPKPAEVGPLRDLLARTFKEESAKDRPASRPKARGKARSSPAPSPPPA